MSDKKEGERKLEAVPLQNPIPLSEAKKDFSKLYKQAESGKEIVTTIKNSGLANVSLVNSDILTAMLESLTIPIEETPDERLGGLTLSIPYLPMYGEGETRQEAVDRLIDAVVEFCGAYVEKLELYSRSETALNKAIMLKLLRCGGDRNAIREALKV